MKLLERYSQKVFGAIRCLDRIRFRGTLRWIASEQGMGIFLTSIGVLLKDSGTWAERKTSGVRKGCEDSAARKGIPFIYLVKGESPSKSGSAAPDAFPAKYCAAAGYATKQSATSAG